MFEKGLARRSQNHLVDAPVEWVERRQRHLFAPVAQEPGHVQHLVAMHRPGPLGGEPSDEALEIAAQLHGVPVSDAPRLEAKAGQELGDGARIIAGVGKRRQVAVVRLPYHQSDALQRPGFFRAGEARGKDRQPQYQ